MHEKQPNYPYKPPTGNHVTSMRKDIDEMVKRFLSPKGVKKHVSGKKNRRVQP